MRTPGVRQDHRTGQFVPTVDGKDQSPTSFDESRALDIASQICRMENNARPGDVANLVFDRDELLQSLKAMCGAYAGTGEQSSASESLNAYEQALQIIAKVESR